MAFRWSRMGKRSSTLLSATLGRCYRDFARDSLFAHFWKLMVIGFRNAGRRLRRGGRRLNAVQERKHVAQHILEIGEFRRMIGGGAKGSVGLALLRQKSSGPAGVSMDASRFRTGRRSGSQPDSVLRSFCIGRS